jgi:hypothetical protein
MTFITVFLIVAVCLLLLLGIGMMRVARHADEAEIEALRALALEAILNRLAEVRSPTGRPFFENPAERQELERALNEILTIEALSELSRYALDEDAPLEDEPRRPRRFQRRRRFSRAQRRGASATRR